MKTTIKNHYSKFNLLVTIIMLLAVNILYGAPANLVNKQTPLRSAVSQNQINIVKTLITNGVNVDEIIKDAEEPTALMLASRYGHKEIMKLLIDNGADVNVRSYDGYTALLLASDKKDPEMVKMLIEHGADVNVKATDGHTPLTSASLSERMDNMKLLIENGADVNVKSPGGDSVLVWEASRRHTEIVKLLIEHGADVNAKSSDGYTALIGASGPGYTEIMKLLIENGADVNAKAKYDLTALTWATVHGQTLAVEVLIQNHVDKESIQSALVEAASLYYYDIVDLLLEHGANPQVLANIRKPPFNPFRDFALNVFGSHHNADLAAFSTYSLLLLCLISLVRLVKQSGNLLWDILIPLIASFQYFLYEAVKARNPMISVDFIIFSLLFTVIGISSLSALIKVLNSK